MATIGTLAVNVIANTSRFARDMTKARGIVGKFSTGIGGAIRTVTRFIGPLAAIGTAALGATVGVRGLVNSFRNLDALAKSSDRLGIAVKDLQALNLAAELGGTSTQVMEKGLSMMLRRASEARLGLSQAKRSFDQLGIAAEDFIGLNTADQFELVAERLSGIESQAERTRIATDIFGRGASEMLNILQDGGATIRQAQADIERFGLALTRTDLRRIEEANDTMTRLRTIMAGIANLVAVQLAPTLTALTNQFLAAGEAGVGFAGSITPLIDSLNQALAFTLTTVERVTAGFKILSQGVGNVDLAIANLTGNTERAQWASEKLAERWREIDRTMGRTAGERFLADVEAARKRAEESFKRLRAAGAGGAGGIGGAGGTTGNAALLQGSEEAFRALVNRQLANMDPVVKASLETADAVRDEGAETRAAIERAAEDIRGALVLEAV